MLAAQGLRMGAVLVTHNTAEFSRVPRLEWKDWQEG
jgi:predicted nucleic acid-binding protein